MITTIWAVDGIRVVLTGADATADPCFTGFATRVDLQDGDPVRLVFTWRAWPTPRGYTTTVTCPFTNHEETFEGPTWSLALEAAAAVKRAFR